MNVILAKKLAGLCAVILLLGVLLAGVPAAKGGPASAATQAETTQTPVAEPPYKGDGSTYTYITTDERDRQWEEDIVYLADSFLHDLNGHPKLIDQKCLVIQADSDTVGEGKWTNANLYDPALRDEFIRHINALILRIHDSSDAELLFGCSEAAALLGDAHSGISLSMDERFPLGVVQFYAEDVPEAYIVAAPKGYEDLLLCRLDAINDVPVSEIISRAAKVIPHENLYLVQNELFYSSNSKVRPCPMLGCDLLRYIGVLGEENTAEFTITEESGATRKIVLSSCQKDLLPEFASYAPPSDTDPSISLRLRDSEPEASGWYRIIDDGKTLYIRISSCVSDTKTIVRKAVKAAAAEDALETVIVDFRGNRGGTSEASKTLVSAINSLDVSGGKYVLIDGGVCSSTIIFSVYLKRYCKGVMLVGTPAGEPPNETFETQGYTSPNQKLKFSMARLKQFYMWPGYDEVALMPDILIGQSLEDYRNDVDSVLKYVLRDGQQTKSSPASEETSVLEPPYKGDGSRYTYITTDERDREWEEDIVYLADTYLHYMNGHPKLIDRQCLVIRADGDTVGKASMTREYLYDPVLRDEFIRQINALILRIHDASDAELLYGCAEAITLLGDAHSNIYFPLNEMFPLGLALFYTEGVPEAYIVAAPKGDEDLLLCRLDAINGVPVSEIITRAAKVTPHENLYYVQYFLFYDTYRKVLPCQLLNCDMLRYIGVLGAENTAEFTITDGSGTTRKIILSSYTKDSLPEFASYPSPSDTDPSISLTLRDSDRETSGWHRIIDDGKALYIRISSCETDSGEIVSRAVEAAAAEDGLEKVIVDFRGNSGGTNAASETIVTAIDSLDVLGGKYVLIDGGVCSATVSFSVYLKRYCKGVMLVGTPAGEPANETFQTSQFTSPNHKLLFLMSILKQFYTWPGYDEDALMPDILIGQSLEDYKNGVDSVLKYILRDDGQQTENSPEPTAEASPVPAFAVPYNGDGSKYAYTMTDDRDRKWEEDIVSFADFYLNYMHGHPKLTDRVIPVREFRYSSGKLFSQSRGQNNTNFLDEALRETFIAEVNNLILSIPSLSDRGIPISLQRIVALLYDAHSIVFFPVDTFLGIFAGPLHTEDGVTYGILFARKEYESLLMSRLNGINGVSIEEVMERIRPLLSRDSDINYQDRACGYYYLSNPDVLRYIGVMGEEDTAILSLTGKDGSEYEYTVTVSSTENWDWNDYVEYDSGTGNDSGDIGIYACGATNFIIYGTESYWYTTVSNGKSVYIRLNRCPSDKNIKTFFQTAFSSVGPAELEKVIIDFRFNNGGDGNMDGGFGTLLALIQESKADIYVLINGTSLSAATIVPALLKQYAEKITLVGSPTGQGVRVFHHSTKKNNSAILPNSKVIVNCSNMYSEAWPGYDEPTLMPDVEIYQSFEDYVNGIDSVLKYVLSEDAR